MTSWHVILGGGGDPERRCEGHSSPWGGRTYWGPPSERPWPGRLAGFGHPIDSPGHEAKQDRIAIAETSSRARAVLRIPAPARLVAWDVESDLLLLVLAGEAGAGQAGDQALRWYLVKQPRARIELTGGKAVTVCR
ncbi:MAG: hypothetical protein JXR96_04420 [Deltaproteobacteria bacterium]|nr:hypothetical protein [Deltaproteobacteria bacterium]